MPSTIDFLGIGVTVEGLMDEMPAAKAETVREEFGEGICNWLNPPICQV